MTEQEFAAELTEALEDYDDTTVRSFAQHGLMTDNTGLVITLADGSEFQVTIVRSR